MRSRDRRRTDWALVVCGLRGHVHVGTDSAQLRPEDAVLARELEGIRWYHCLRCGTWSATPPPAAPAREHPPGRDEIEIPLRGQALRDRIVLRLIAVDRALHFVILVTLGIAVLLLEAHQKTARGKLERVLTAIQNAIGGGPVQAKGHVGFIGELDRVLTLHSRTLIELGIVLLAYGGLEGIEAVGLWLTKRWAEYLTFIATTILLPLEIYELTSRVSVLKIIGFLVNVAIVIYLLLAKRLFGLRGGGAVDEARRAADMSWEAIERAVPAERVPVG